MDSEDTTPIQNQSRVTLARVKDLVARLDSEKKSRPSYTANPCLSGPDLAAWEAANGVLLPELYRLFLREIGNGGFMPGGYGDFEMWELDASRVDARLRKPFPVSRDRFEQRMAQFQTEGRGYITHFWDVEGWQDALFPELSDNAYWAHGFLLPGCLQLGLYPGSDRVFLLVSGDLHGTIWSEMHKGFPCLVRQGKPFDFLGWFEDALLEFSGLKYT